MRYTFQDLECDNHVMEVVKWVMKNNQLRINKQCFSCGETDSAALKHTAENLKTKKYLNEQLRDEFYKKRQEYKKTHFWNWYSEYLKSDEWKEKRVQVFKRDNGKCLRCDNKAEQVHHTTYKNVGAEYLSELESICNECHEVIHFIIDELNARVEIIDIKDDLRSKLLDGRIKNTYCEKGLEYLAMLES